MSESSRPRAAKSRGIADEPEGLNPRLGSGSTIEGYSVNISAIDLEINAMSTIGLVTNSSDQQPGPNQNALPAPSITIEVALC